MTATPKPNSPPSPEMVENVAQAIFDEHHYSYEAAETGHLASQHPDDVERAMRQARAAITAMQAAPEGDDAKIEHVARAMSDAVNAGKPPIVQWDRLHREERELYETAARAAIAAMAAPLVERGMVEARLRSLVRQYVDPFDVMPDDHALVVAIGTDDEAAYHAALARADAPKVEMDND
jgi:hypothetical protein